MEKVKSCHFMIGNMSWKLPSIFAIPLMLLVYPIAIPVFDKTAIGIGHLSAMVIFHNKGSTSNGTCDFDPFW